MQDMGCDTGIQSDSPLFSNKMSHQFAGIQSLSIDRFTGKKKAVKVKEYGLSTLPHDQKPCQEALPGYLLIILPAIVSPRSRSCAAFLYIR